MDLQYQKDTVCWLLLWLFVGLGCSDPRLQLEADATSGDLGRDSSGSSGFRFSVHVAVTDASAAHMGLSIIDQASKQHNFLDLGSLAFNGNPPSAELIYENNKVIRIAVTQQYKEVDASNRAVTGAVILVEIDKATQSSTLLLNEVSAGNRWSYLISRWNDCDGDGIKDWVHSYGQEIPVPGGYATHFQGVKCRSSLDGHLIRTITLPSTHGLIGLTPDVDGDGAPDFVTIQSSTNMRYGVGSKALANIFTFTGPNINTGFSLAYYFDLSGDGYPEFLYWQPAGSGRYSGLTTYSGKSSASISPPITFPALTFGFFVDIGSFTKPGSKQLLFYNYGTGSIYGNSDELWIFNLDGTLDTKLTYADFVQAMELPSSCLPVPANVECLVQVSAFSPVGDLDGDGVQELANYNFGKYYVISPKKKSLIFKSEIPKLMNGASSLAKPIFIK